MNRGEDHMPFTKKLLMKAASAQRVPVLTVRGTLVPDTRKAGLRAYAGART